MITKKLVLLLIVLVALDAVAGKLDSESESNGSTAKPGLASESTLQKVSFGGNTFLVYRVNLRENNLVLVRTDENGNRIEGFHAVKTLVESTNQEVSFITNGGIFDPHYNPSGLYVENGRKLFPLNSAEGSGNFFLKPNGVFLLKGEQGQVLSTKEYAQALNTPDFAIQSGPLLLRKGTIHPKFNKTSRNRYTRSAIAVMSSTELFFVLSMKPVTFFDIADFCARHLSCEDALYLDGAISQFYTPGSSRSVVQRPYGSYFVVTPK